MPVCAYDMVAKAVVPPTVSCAVPPAVMLPAHPCPKCNSHEDTLGDYTMCEWCGKFVCGVCVYAGTSGCATCALLHGKSGNRKADLLRKLLDLPVNRTTAFARLQLALCYEKGTGGAPKDVYVAFALARLSAEEKCAPAMVVLAGYFHNGIGVAKHEASNVALLTLAHNSGNATATAKYAMCHLSGIGMPVNLNVGHSLMSAAIDKNSAEAYCAYGSFLRDGLYGIEINKKLALEVYKRAADCGYVPAMMHLGRMLHDGDGVAVHHEMGSSFYARAAAAGSFVAMRMLAWDYFCGNGVPRDPSEGVRLLTAASDLDFPLAKHELGTLYCDGPILSVDMEKAKKLLREAIDLGHKRSKGFLGVCLIKNLEYIEGVRWLKEACDQGQKEAMTQLGICYEKGIGLAINNELAVEWYTKAAELSHPQGCYQLSLMHASGRGVVASAVEADKWLKKSASLGYVVPKHHLSAHPLPPSNTPFSVPTFSFCVDQPEDMK